MYAGTATIHRPIDTPHRGFPAEPPGHVAGRRSPYRELFWRRPTPDTAPHAAHDANIVASRWIDERSLPRIERNRCPADRYTIAIALRPVRLKLRRGGETVFEGTMPTGMIHVAEPGQTIEAEFFTPCDFVHFHVAADYLIDRQCAAAARSPQADEAARDARSLRDLMVRDELAAQLSRALTDDLDGGDPLYAESVGQTILMRILALRPPMPRVGALPKWRLRRVQEHLAANLAEPISLASLAKAAGLSRMHFAAQFRVAMGCRPHDYLLQHRIECAKQLLADTDTPLVQVALSVGFQTQSHFSTVFKRLAGNTPARWQHANRVP